MAKIAKSWSGAKFARLSEKERKRLLKEMLLEAVNPNNIWIFGFGSLMWNPGFKPREKRRVLLRGFERKFHIWSTSGRGSEERPGLGLCLEPARRGTCRGIAYRISSETRDQDLKYLWDREMMSGIYQPRWVTVERDDGSDLRTLTWVVNENHVRYAGPRSVGEMARIMADSKGKHGSCRDYLINTIREMANLGDHDPTLNEVLALIDNENSGC